MVLNNQNLSSAQFQDGASESSCRFNSSATVNHSSYLTTPLHESGNQPLDFSQRSQHSYDGTATRHIEEWLHNGYYQSPAHSVAPNMLPYRYNPYSPYPLYGYHAAAAQNFQQVNASHHLSPVASTSPVSSIGSTSPPSDHHVPTVNFDWMRTAGTMKAKAPGKTRTKDKYRVVYTDLQRLELEKEFCFNKFITQKRKQELATALSLSGRQVKIWFQNRRAKERRQRKSVEIFNLQDSTETQISQETHDIKNVCGDTNNHLTKISYSDSQSPVTDTFQSERSQNLLQPMTSPFPWEDISGSDSNGSPPFI